MGIHLWGLGEDIWGREEIRKHLSTHLCIEEDKVEVVGDYVMIPRKSDYIPLDLLIDLLIDIKGLQSWTPSESSNHSHQPNPDCEARSVIPSPPRSHHDSPFFPPSGQDLDCIAHSCQAPDDRFVAPYLDDENHSPSCTMCILCAWLRRHPLAIFPFGLFVGFTCLDPRTTV